MAILAKSKRLKKQLTLPFVLALAIGTTLSSGFFLLPGIAAQQAGPAVVLSYIIAALPLIPAVFSISELGTAMPRAGGVYYFIDRSMGPLFGTIAGLGTWLALILKTAFALIGMGAYISLVVPEFNILPAALGLTLFFGAINLFGAKESAVFQVVMVIGLLLILALFMIKGVPEIQTFRFENFFDAGADSIFATAGLVYISYVGITKVASVAEEIHEPERTLPLGIMLAMGTAVVIYIVGITIMIGVLPKEALYGNLTPVASAAEVIFGKVGVWIMIAAALLAFFSVANAGILSASRYPMAMSRDHLAPKIFRSLSAKKTPIYSVYLTVGLIIVVLLILDPTKIAKLASAFQLLMLSFVCLAVIVMRESRIQSYDPGYKSPLYPWMQIVGVIFSLWLIFEMGFILITATGGLVFLGILWYYFYAKKNVYRSGAIYHIFARLGKQRYDELDSELRGIMREKGLRDEDPFDILIANAKFVDMGEKHKFSEVVRRASLEMSKMVHVNEAQLYENFMEGTIIGATPVSHGVALPHTRLTEIFSPEMVVVRSVEGIKIDSDIELLSKEDEDKPIHAFFFLASPEDNPAQHLRLLAKLADIADDDDFMEDWLDCKTEQEMKEILHREENFLSLVLAKESLSSELIGKEIKELDLPETTLITMIHRGAELVVPRGGTKLLAGDRLTIIGKPKDIENLKKRYL